MKKVTLLIWLTLFLMCIAIGAWGKAPISDWYFYYGAGSTPAPSGGNALVDGPGNALVDGPGNALIDGPN